MAHYDVERVVITGKGGRTVRWAVRRSGVRKKLFKKKGDAESIAFKMNYWEGLRVE